MKTKISKTAPEKKMLDQLAERVLDLHHKTQAASSVDRAHARALYREAYIAHRAHKVFVTEQELRLRYSTS